MSQQRAPAEQAILQELLEEIESLRVGAEWEIDQAFVLDLLNLSREEHARQLYREGAIVSDQLDVPFNQENAAGLVELLERNGVKGAEDGFARAGLFLSEGRLLHWLEFFQSVTLSQLHSHGVDRELLETAISGCRRFEDAAAFYCHCRFDRQAMVDFAMRLFLERNRISDHHLSRSFLLNFLNHQFRPGWLSWDGLFATIEGLLRERAVTWKLADPAPADHGSEAIPPAVREALQVFELPPNRLPSSGELKSRYRRLLKQYHPDINPEGAARTRSVIAAYSTLVGRKTGPRRPVA